MYEMHKQNSAAPVPSTSAVALGVLGGAAVRAEGASGRAGAPRRSFRALSTLRVCNSFSPRQEKAYVT